jgi:excisionase family DNA binding protein
MKAINGHPEQLLNITQIGFILGVDRAWVRRLFEENKLPIIFVGKERRTPRFALRAFLEKESQTIEQVLYGL